MITSMTGFGRSELKSAIGFIRVEIKTTNHKFLEISSRLPNHLGEFEEEIRKTVSQSIRRGKVFLGVSCPDLSLFSSKLILNEGLAKEVHQKIERLRKILKLVDPGINKARNKSMILKEVLHYPDVLVKDTSTSKRTLFYKDIDQAVLKALGSLRVSRLAEGRVLSKDILGRVDEMRRSLSVIKKRIPVLTKEYKKNLHAKMKEFLPAPAKNLAGPSSGGKSGSASGGKNGEIDHDRLTLEVALYCKNSDISEEVTRLRSHMDSMQKALRENGELGRKIDFIAQEMYRESNTMGAKSSDVAIANAVIQIKSAIEKIREQAQNVE